MSKTYEIWCLFSIDNDYNQPANNLVVWFKEKPSIERLCECFNLELDTDDNVLFLAGIFTGKEMRLVNTDYRLERVKEGVNLDE